jgi:hypothetical protein
VRRALAKLGPNAMPTEIREWVRAEFSLDVEPNSISAFKTMLRKGAGNKKSKRGPAKSQGPTISKMDAVRGALRKLGRGAKPQDIQSFIKSEFHVEMEPTLISTTRATSSGRPPGGAGRLASMLSWQLPQLPEEHGAFLLKPSLSAAPLVLRPVWNRARGCLFLARMLTVIAL